HGARESLICVEDRASAFAHPTRLCIALGQKKSAPVSALGQGVARIPLLPSPSKTRGSARRQGALPGLLRAGCPDCSGREGVKRHAPHLAARQRGILAFMPLTVVGPGRVASARRGCPSTARGRWLRLPSLAGAAP